MFLGNGKSRRTNVNHLHCAFHPEHGLVWTDGQCVYLSVISVNQNDVTASPPTTLGQFGSVEQVAWSSDTTQCHLVVQHTASVTVWKVDKQFEKLKFYKAIEIQQQAIPQGCLWHPYRTLLVILCRDQLLLVNPEKASTQTLSTNAHPRVTAGTWSLNGSKVVVALGSDICIYELNGGNRLVKERTLQNFSGPITALIPVTSDLIAAALSLPLEQLVSQSQQDMFEAAPLDELLTENKGGDNQIKPTVLCSESEVKGHTGLSPINSNGSGDQTLEREILQRTGPVDVNALIRRRARNQTPQAESGFQTEDKFHPDCTKDQRTISRSLGENEKLRIDIMDRSVTSTSSAQTPDDKPSEGLTLAGMLRPITGSGGDSESRLHRPEGSQETLDLRGLRCDPTVDRGKARLRFKRVQQEQVSESSQLVLVDLDGSSSHLQGDTADCIVSSVDLPYVLNPDLLVYQRSCRLLLVGSNTQTKCYQVSVHDGPSLRGLRLIDLKLAEQERCLGMCTLPHIKDLLLLAGEPPLIQDVTFLPSSSFSEYQFKLRMVNLNCDTASTHLEEERSSESLGASSHDPMSDFPPLTLPNGGLLSRINTAQLSSSKIVEVTDGASAQCPESEQHP